MMEELLTTHMSSRGNKYLFIIKLLFCSKLDLNIVLITGFLFGYIIVPFKNKVTFS